MASAMPFEQPAFNWDASDTFQEFQRFKQHVQFTFKGPLSKADNKDKAGWLGSRLTKHGPLTDSRTYGPIKSP